jgi:DAACS family dicarboxylate/amino acid:cation (Na+ or H+) symporter
LFTVLVSAIAVGIGVGLVTLFRPGDGLAAGDQAKLKMIFKKNVDEALVEARKAKPLQEILTDIVPQNPVEAAAQAFDPRGGGMISVMFFALIFGIALTRVRSESADSVRRLLEGTFEVLMKIIGGAMALAPIGVGALVFSTTATLGVEFLVPLAKYAGIVILGLALHQFGVYSLILRFMCGISPWAFFRRIQEVMLTAFATASSNATLPTSLRVSQERLAIPKEISNFVLTLGSTANQNGTALYEGVTLLFLAQLFGVELTLVQQIMIVVFAVVAGIGTAGVPGGSLPMLVILLQSIQVEPSGVAIIVGVDRLLDMCRTTLNVTGDLAVAAYVARSEGHSLKLAD